MSRNKKAIVRLETLRKVFEKQVKETGKSVVSENVYDLSGWALSHAKEGSDVKVDAFLNHMQSAAMENKVLKKFVKDTRNIYAM